MTALTDTARSHCDCGATLRLFGTGANWGDLRCSKCRKAYCQDCGEPLNRATLQCTAYVAAKETEDQPD